MTLRHIVSFMLLFCLFWPQAQASEFDSLPAINIQQFPHGDYIDSDYQYLADPDFSYTFEQVLTAGNWQTAVPGQISRGVEPQAVWMRFKLQNPNSFDFEASLRYLDASYKSIELFYRYPEQSNGFEVKSFVYGQDHMQQPKSTLRPTFDLTVQGNSELEVYARIIGSTDFAVAVFSSFEIWPSHVAERAEHKEIFWLTGLFLLQIAIAFAAFVTYLSVKDKTFLLYSFFALSTSISLAGLNGIWPYFIAETGYVVNDVMLPLNVMHLFAFMFVSDILQLKEKWYSAWLYMRGWIIFAAAGLALDIVGADMISRYMVEISALNYISICVISFISYRREIPEAGLLTVTWFIFTIGVFVQPMRNWGVLEHCFLTQWLLFIGAFIETWLLVVVLGVRLNRSSEEKHALQTEYKRHLENSAQELQEQVKAKTAELISAKELAEKDARTDVLTGIANRRAFWETAKIFVAGAHRNQLKLHLAVLDLDHFKAINDKYGHGAGDEVLKAFANLLVENSRQADLIARIGGEEFAVIMSAQNDGAAMEVCERIRGSLDASKFTYGDIDLSSSVSIGLASYNHNDTLDSLFSRADQALYMAKSAGRNRVQMYHDSWEKKLEFGQPEGN